MNNCYNIKPNVSHNQFTDSGQGYAIFNADHIEKRTKRYYLEKKWKQDGETFTVVLMNPSTADSLSTDTTVKELYNYARFYSCRDYNLLVVVNIIPDINSKSGDLKVKLKEKHQTDLLNMKFIKSVLNNSKHIFIGWGGIGHKYFLQNMAKDNDIKRLLTDPNKNYYAYNFSVIRILQHKFPLHPMPHYSTKFIAENGDKQLENAREKLKNHF